MKSTSSAASSSSFVSSGLSGLSKSLTRISSSVSFSGALLLLLFAASTTTKLAQAEEPAQGQGPSLADRSTGTQLFKEGRALLAEGHVAEACRKLEESQRVDPGGGTLLNLALCHEREGRTSTAWVEFTEALGIAKRDGRAQRVEFAQAHIAQLEPLLSRLAIEVPVVSELPGLEIKRDGNVVGRAAWGSGIPVDPGEHVVEAAAPGKISWTQVVVTPKASNMKVEVPVLQNNASGAVAAAPVVVQQANAAHEPSPATTPSPGDQAARSSTYVPAIVSFSVGALAAGAGTYFGIRAIEKKNAADDACKEGCTAAGVSDNDSAIRFANLSTGFLAAGAVGIGIGAILVLTHAPASSAKARAVAPKLALSLDSVSVSREGLAFAISSHW